MSKTRERVADPTRKIAETLDQIGQSIKKLRQCYWDRGDIYSDEGPWRCEQMALAHEASVRAKRRRARRAKEERR